VRVGHFGIGLNGGPELFDRAGIVFHFVVGFTGQHIGFSGFCIQCHDFVVDVKNALILP